MRHDLRPLKQGEEQRKNKFIVCDIETMNWTKFLVIGVYDGKTIKHFRSLSKFLDYILENYNDYDCFAHFGGVFDFLFILKACLLRSDINVQEMVPRGSGLLYFDIEHRKSGARICFRDDSALLPFSLRTLTENFEVTHKKQEWDHSKTEGVSAQLLEYLDYDLKGLYEVLEKFYSWPIINKAGPAYTTASQALRVFRTYQKKSIPSLCPGRIEGHSHDTCLDTLIRPAYLGGRVEIFKPVYEGKKSLYAYDVNSLYPKVMRDNIFPGHFEYETDYWEPKKLGFYYAEVEVPENMYIPPLGIVLNGKFVFPTGKFKGFWSIAELNYAKSLGIKIIPGKGYIFDSAGFIFKQFISELYKIRLNAKSMTDKTIAKLLMNSCYGRFGLNLQKENIVFDDGSLGLKELRELRVGKKTYRLMTKEITLETFTHVGIAAYVTSYARIYMHRLFMQAPKHLYYTDTDSLYTTFKYPTGNGLGQLKLEDTVKSACFLLPKTYLAGSKIRMKGFDAKKIKHFTMDDFYACLEGDLKRLKIKQEPKVAKLKTGLRTGNLVGMTKESTRQIRSHYDKRIIYKEKGNYETKAIVL